MSERSTCQPSVKGPALGGSFQFKNFSKFTILSGDVVHRSGDETSSDDFQNLAAGEIRPPTPFGSSFSLTDQWSASLTLSNNLTFDFQKDCGFELADEGGIVVLAFGTDGGVNGTLAIEPPVSSPCSVNAVGQQVLAP